MNLDNWKIRILKKMPYDDLGHYTDSKKTFGCFQTGSDDYNFLIIVHELIELYLIHRYGLTSKDIDRYDTKTKQPYNHKGYRAAHWFATKVEKTVCKYLKIDWQEYEKYLDKLEIQHD